MQTIAPYIKGNELHCMQNTSHTANYMLNISNSKRLQLLSKCVAAYGCCSRLRCTAPTTTLPVFLARTGWEQDSLRAPRASVTLVLPPLLTWFYTSALRNDAQRLPYFSSVPYFMLGTIRMFKFVRVRVLTTPWENFSIRCWCPGKGNSYRPHTGVYTNGSLYNKVISVTGLLWENYSLNSCACLHGHLPHNCRDLCCF